MADKLAEINHLESIRGLLEWDQVWIFISITIILSANWHNTNQQVMMPAGADALRGKQNAVIAGVVHDKKISKELQTLIEELHPNMCNPAFNEWEQVGIIYLILNTE